LPPPPPPPPVFVVPKASGGSNRGWKIATLVLAVLFGLSFFGHLLSAFVGLMVSGATPNPSDSRLQEITLEQHRSDDKIAVIPVEGIITSSGSDGLGYGMVRLIEDQLKMAAKDEHVKAVLLKVNSPGGEVLAADDIYQAIMRFQKENKKPVIASMGSLAASGGYYVSAPCRWIVANELTMTGSIGVIMHGYNYRGLMNKVGLRPMVYKSGRFKDMLSGEKDLDQLTPKEKADLEEEESMVTRMISETYDKFKSIVDEGRTDANRRNQANKDGNSGRKLSERWAELADGRILSGKQALENGLVDELGGWRTAIDRAEGLAGLDKADLVTYQVPFSLGNFLGLLGQANGKSVKVDLGFDFPKLRAGLYYLAPSLLN
jgi:protease-4